MNLDYTDEIKEFIEKERDINFYINSGVINSKEDILRRLEEIPEKLRLTSDIIYKIGLDIINTKVKKKIDINCSKTRELIGEMLIRLVVFNPKLKDLLYIPDGWYISGESINPMEVINIVNGLLSWEGGRECEYCINRNKCVFYKIWKKHLRLDFKIKNRGDIGA